MSLVYKPFDETFPSETLFQFLPKQQLFFFLRSLSLSIKTWWNNLSEEFLNIFLIIDQIESV